MGRGRASREGSERFEKGACRRGCNEGGLRMEEENETGEDKMTANEENKSRLQR